jgi:hypothetical protein
MPVLGGNVPEEIATKAAEYCKANDCNKSRLVRRALEAYLGSPLHAGPAKSTPVVGVGGSKPFDIIDERSGSIKRYRPNGELMNHFMPIQKKDGVQYYRDILGDSSEWLFYKNKSNEWVALSVGRVRK